MPRSIMGKIFILKGRQGLTGGTRHIDISAKGALPAVRRGSASGMTIYRVCAHANTMRETMDYRRPYNADDDENNLDEKDQELEGGGVEEDEEELEEDSDKEEE